MKTLVKKEKNLNVINHLENQNHSKTYTVQTGGQIIKSYLAIDMKNLIAELSFYDGNTYYESFYKVKSQEKAINLLLRAEKDFRKFTKRHGAPTIHTMQKEYKSYFSAEELETGIDW